MNTRERYAKYLLPVAAQGVEPVVVASATFKSWQLEICLVRTP